ncbi:MAG TPA: ATP-dependent helicase [Myxococcota bacterium]|nr:ATP-dependent helicase [Myxococcota bacterium]
MKNYLLTAPVVKKSRHFEDLLNPQQLEAACAPDGAVLVIAGAGSGKTRMLTYRVAFLLQKSVRASSIALCTFTNKAAKEMLTRVGHLASSGSNDVMGGTFHHLANKFLREFAVRLGFDPDFGILDREDSRDLMADCIAEREKKGSGRMLPRPPVLCDLVSHAANTLQPLDDVVSQRSPSFARIADQIMAIATIYANRKRKMNTMDFDDLLTNLNELLSEQSDVRDEISSRCKHVLVDEYQDTNPLQCQIIDRLAAIHENLTVVGDDAQSIYSFRGASLENMLTFSDRWPAARRFFLETNYRSTPQILVVANKSIAHNMHQLPKKLSAVRGDGRPPVLAVVRDVDQQAAFVAQRLLELAGEGIALRDMAVLYRAHYHSMELQLELARREIPFVVRSGVRFFEQAHIKDVLAHLRLYTNPLDELSWLRILKMQPGIGRSGAIKIFSILGNSSSPFASALDLGEHDLPQRSRPGWKSLRERLIKINEAGSDGTQAIIEAVLQYGYRDLLPTLFSNPENRLEDIEQLAEYSKHFPDTRAFLSELNLLSSIGSEDVLGADHQDDHLILSSIHQAKGLEWKVVFTIGLNEGLFPHPRSLSEEGGDEEERRLFYVSITRAMDELYLVCPLVADRQGRRRAVMRQSRFVDEVASGDAVERWSIKDAT